MHIKVDWYSLETWDLQKAICSAQKYTQKILEVFLWGLIQLTQTKVPRGATDTEPCSASGGCERNCCARRTGHWLSQCSTL